MTPYSLPYYVSLCMWSWNSERFLAVVSKENLSYWSSMVLSCVKHTSHCKCMRPNENDNDNDGDDDSH